MRNLKAEKYDSIPSLAFPGDNIPELELKDDRFVDIEEYSGGQIICRPAYFLRGIKGALNRALMREKAAEKLAKASDWLPEGFRFCVLDAWRPFEVQYSLYCEYFCNLAFRQEYQTTSVMDLHKTARRFVSFPERESNISYVHSSGGAVDLTIIDKEGNEICMGSKFDEFSERSNVDYYENRGENAQAQHNRRMLYQIMKRAGFTNLPSEWWHYDYGDRFWSFYTGEKIIYKSVYDIPKEFKEKVIIHG